MEEEVSTTKSRARPVPEAKKYQVWNDTLSRFSWRVDLKSSSRQVPEINQPTAVIEIETTSGSEAVCDHCLRALLMTNTKVPKKVIHFEMSTEQMAIALMQMEAIQKAIDNASQ